MIFAKDDKEYLELLRDSTKEGVKFFLERPRDDNHLDLELVAEFSPKDDESDMTMCLFLQSSLLNYIESNGGCKVDGPFFFLSKDLATSVLDSLKIELVNELLMEESEIVRDVLDMVDMLLSLNDALVLRMRVGESNE